MTTHESRILSYVSGQPWAIVPASLDTVVSEAIAGAFLEPKNPRAAFSIEQARKPKAAKIGVVQVHGVIEKREFLQFFGPVGSSTDRMSEAVRALAADDDVSGILLDVDSPGGTTHGVQELASEIAHAGKPVVAFAGGQMASAAYWIASAADSIIAAPSSMLGSIGVFYTHENVAAALEKEGVELTMISAGKYKLEGHPALPLTDAAKSHFQSVVDTIYGQFVSTVAVGRGVKDKDVRGGFGKGRMLTSETAVAEGLADDVGTFSDALAALVDASGSRSVELAATTRRARLTAAMAGL